MKTPIAVAILALVACNRSAGDDYMVVGDDIGPHPGSNQSPDAALVDAFGTGSGISGRVCLAADSRELSACAGSGAGGFLVTFGSGSAITADDGEFTLTPLEAGSRWEVSGSDIMTSEASSPIDVPAIGSDLYNDMIANTGGILLNSGEGAVIARIVHAGAPEPGALVTSQDAVSDVFYDPPTDDTVWNDNQFVGTGDFGVAWIPVEPEGLVSLTVSLANETGSAVGVPNIEVVDQAITFVDVTLP